MMYCFFFFKQKTAYEMRISDWSSDVCSSDLLRRLAEPLITRAKTDSVHNRRLAFARLRDRDAVQKLFNELGPRYNTRPGGYLRILKCGFRAGDDAPMAYVELVDRPDRKSTRLNSSH